MSDNDRAHEQMQLLVDMIPFVSDEFALAGGTAINLFHRELPRYSVDMDLVYLPQNDRVEATGHMRDLMEQMRREAQQNVRGAHISQVKGGKTGLMGIDVSRGDIVVKIEAPVTARETLHPTAVLDAVPAAESVFGPARMRVVSFADMYAGKMRASLGRRQLRDMFDIVHLLRHEGITDELFRTFLVYVVAGRRPPGLTLSEEWHSRMLPPQKRWDRLMRVPLPPEHMLTANNELRAKCVERITPQARKFLLDSHDGVADPGLIGVPQAATWPAFLWRMQQRTLFRANRPQEHAWQRRQLEALGREAYDVAHRTTIGFGRGDNAIER